MSQKKTDHLRQINPPKSELNENFIKGSIVEYLKGLGINSRNATHEKIVQTTLVFTNKVEPNTKEDDAIYASLRYLKYKRQRHKY